MSEPGRLDVAIASREGEHVVRLIGELEAVTAPILEEELRRLVADGKTQITLELGDLKFIDSNGLAALVDALGRLRETGGDMILSSPGPSIRKVLEISGLASVFRVVP